MVLRTPFESFNIDIASLGAALTTRYGSMTPVDVQIEYTGTAGSVTVLVRRG